jgi:GT2 family glycosyltransferase
MSALGFIRHRAIAGIRDEGGLLPAMRKALSLLFAGGLRNLFLGEAYVPGVSYQEWVDRFDTIDDSQRRQILSAIAQMETPPLISVLLPSYNTPLPMLRAAVESVLQQLYPHWELCIADDASTDPELRSYLERLPDDARIKTKFREQNGHISAATNSALELATGDWIVTLDHDDALACDALFACASAIVSDARIRMIYSDEDKLNGKGRRVRPYFKPGFNRELLRGNNYICHLACYRRLEVLEIGGFRQGFEGAQDHDLALRYTERLDRDEICHLPKVLYHWREHSGSTALGMGVKGYALSAGVKALEEHLSRSGLSARVTANTRGYYEVRYALPADPPSVTIIIPTRDSLELLSQCVDSIRTRTDYPSYKILVIDNGSTCPDTLAWLSGQSAADDLTVLRDDGPFNYAALNNRGVEEAASEYVLLLNNDTEVISSGWLADMVATAHQPGVGAVGAKLLYDDGSVQHCGVIVGIGGSAGHAFKGHSRAGLGYYFRAAVRSEFSAVTGACLLVSRELYRSSGGLDAQRLKIAFNDIDFCLRLHSSGLRNVVCPDALLYHYESKSRGYEDTPEKAARFAAERACLRQRWPEFVQDDPAYNPNLTRDDEHFSHERRFVPGKPDGRPESAGDDDFDRLAHLGKGVSPALILLLKRICSPPERSVGIVVVGEQAPQFARLLRSLRPVARIVAVTNCPENIEAKAAVDRPWCELGHEGSEPYPVDLVIQLDGEASLPPEADSMLSAFRACGAIVHLEKQYTASASLPASTS